MDDVAIKVENVSKDFVLPHEKVNSIKGVFTSLAKGKAPWKIKGTQHALKNVSFEIKKGEFFGIVGRNGSGKSTMLKMLATIYQPTKGKISTQGKLVPFIELGVGFNPELTGRENVYLNGAMLGFSKTEVQDMYNDIVEFAELHRFMDQKLKNYSSGMQVRLAFSMATRSNADILLVDEVLAVGDADFQRKCFRYFKQLKREKKTVVFVTHDMDAVREYCDRALLIDSQEVITQGDPDTVARGYTKLMMPHDINRQSDKTNRWGDGTCKISDVIINKLDEQELIFSYKVTALKDREDPVYGFRIRNSQGAGLLGNNSLVLGNKPQPIKAKECVKVTWRIPNIFTDGDYFLDPSVVYEGMNTVADWQDGSLIFVVARERITPYLAQPEMTFEANKL